MLGANVGLAPVPKEGETRYGAIEFFGGYSIGRENCRRG